MTDAELAEAYYQHVETIDDWLAAARKTLKDLDPDSPEGREKRRLISGLRAQKRQLLEDAARLSGGPQPMRKRRRARGGRSSPPGPW